MLGAKLRAGEHGTPVVNYGQSSRTTTNEQTGEEKEADLCFLIEAAVTAPINLSSVSKRKKLSSRQVPQPVQSALCRLTP